MCLVPVQHNTVKITGEVAAAGNAVRHMQCSVQFSGQRAQLALLLSNRLPSFPTTANWILKLKKKKKKEPNFIFWNTDNNFRFSAGNFGAFVKKRSKKVWISVSYLNWF